MYCENEKPAIYYGVKQVVNIDSIPIRKDDGTRILIGRHPGIILAITDEHFYFITTTTHFYRHNGRFFVIKREHNRNIHVDLDCVYRRPNIQQVPRSEISHIVFSQIVTRLFKNQRRVKYNPDNYFTEIKDQLQPYINPSSFVKRKGNIYGKR